MTDLLDFVRPMGEDAGGTASALGILLRVTVLLLAAMLVAVGLRRSSAALRHLVWTLSLVGTLLIPLCYWAFPAWQWAILPQRQQSPSPSIAPVAKTRRWKSPLRRRVSPRSFRRIGRRVFRGPGNATARPVAERLPTAAPLRLNRRGPGRCFLPPSGPWGLFWGLSGWGSAWSERGMSPGVPSPPPTRIGVTSCSNCSPRAVSVVRSKSGNARKCRSR